MTAPGRYGAGAGAAKGHQLYFAYGSNVSRGQMAERAPDARPAGPAILENYRLTFVGHSRTWNGGVATIVPLHGWKVPGALYRVSPADIELLDRFEGHPTVYRRREISVRDENNKLVTALVYVRTRSGEPFAEPSEAYVERIRSGYRGWGFPRACVIALEWAADPALFPPGPDDTFPQ